MRLPSAEPLPAEIAKQLLTLKPRPSFEWMAVADLHKTPFVPLAPALNVQVLGQTAKFNPCKVTLVEPLEAMFCLAPTLLNAAESTERRVCREEAPPALDKESATFLVDKTSEPVDLHRTLDCDIQRVSSHEVATAFTRIDATIGIPAPTTVTLDAPLR